MVLCHQPPPPLVRVAPHWIHEPKPHAVILSVAKDQCPVFNPSYQGTWLLMPPTSPTLKTLACHLILRYAQDDRVEQGSCNSLTAQAGSNEKCY
ncbi:MAG: hypothetical protein QOH93_2576 [Chloroflexia bacterium]|nr:hypothetical protein [Chloroflexia bacterium]